MSVPLMCIFLYNKIWISNLLKQHTAAPAPSGNHPSYTRIEEELSKMKTWESSSTSSSCSVSTGMTLLEDLYISLEDLLNIASTQKAISQHQDDKCMEEILDGSVKILDICGITRDTILQVKENDQTLQSSLRRRKGDSNIETSIAEYNFFTKNMKKIVNKLVKSLKQMESKFGVPSSELACVIKVVREVIAMTISTFQSLFSFLAGPASKSKSTKWVAKLMHKKVISCEEKSLNEFENVEACLRSVVSEGSSRMQGANERLEALENGIESVESGLECIFRCLVKTRVQLLNILSQ